MSGGSTESSPLGPPPSGARTAQLARGLGQVRDRIARACREHGRPPEDVHLVVVTKTYPASDVLALLQLGVRDVGENIDQQAAAKAAEVHEARSALGDDSVEDPLHWHFVGQLQSNKAGSVARYCDSVHAVDRLRLVRALGRAAAGRDEPLGCFVQVNLDPDGGGRDDRASGRGGVAPDGVAELTDAVAADPALALRGVMAVAPPAGDPRVAFGRLAEIAAEVARAHPGADAISAGMSADLEAAVAAGATHLRVGGAILGARDPEG